MKILLFVLLPVLVVTVYALYIWVRNHEPSSVESGVDAFRREMTALSPDAAPQHRRPERSPGPGGSPTDDLPRQAPRRPPGPAGEAGPSQPDGLR